ncbi:MAG TPA: murein hydrolase activator EnvC family protein [Elainellaceae cyanobacterium]
MNTRMNTRSPLSLILKLALGVAIACVCLIGTITFSIQGEAPASFLLSSSAHATAVDSLQHQQQQIERERNRLRQERDRLENMEESAQDRLENLEDNIQVTSEQIKSNEQQLQSATQQLKTLQNELAIAEENFQTRQFATIARLRFLQRQQGSQGWAVLLQSQDLNEFLDRRRQLRLVYESDRQILATLQQDAQDIDRRKRNVEAQKNDIALLTQQLQLQKSEFEAQAKTQGQLVSRLKQDRQALEEAEERLARDSANIAVLIRERLIALGNDGVIVRGAGPMIYPANGRLTSGFGYRVHPILGYRRFHAGIDFGATYGSMIRAADAGRVIFAGWYGGYGRAVVIDHGGNLTTLYAHTSQVYVAEGQMVQQGEAIAAIGSTGLSTGPHLHFEVRVNGEPVNPMNYL